MGIFEEAAAELAVLSEEAMPDSVLFDVPGPLVADGKGSGYRPVLTTRGPFDARVRGLGSPAEVTFADQLETRGDEVLTVPREVDVSFKERGTYTYKDTRTFRLEVVGVMPRSSYGPQRKAIVRRLRAGE